MERGQYEKQENYTEFTRSLQYIDSQKVISSMRKITLSYIFVQYIRDCSKIRILHKNREVMGPSRLVFWAILLIKMRIFFVLLQPLMYNFMLFSKTPHIYRSSSSSLNNTFSILCKIRSLNFVLSSSNSISPEQISCVYLILYIIQTIVIAVCNNGMTSLFELIQIVHNN